MEGLHLVILEIRVLNGQCLEQLHPGCLWVVADLEVVLAEGLYQFLGLDESPGIDHGVEEHLQKAHSIGQAPRRHEVESRSHHKLDDQSQHADQAQDEIGVGRHAGARATWIHVIPQEGQTGPREMAVEVFVGEGNIRHTTRKHNIT